MFFSFSNLYIQNWTVTLSVWLHDLTRLWAITAGQSISVGSVNSCSAVYVGSPHQSPVAWVGGMHVGKGKVYNHVHAADAMPSQIMVLLGTNYMINAYLDKCIYGIKQRVKAVHFNKCFSGH